MTGLFLSSDAECVLSCCCKGGLLEDETKTLKHWKTKFSVTSFDSFMKYFSSKSEVNLRWCESCDKMSKTELKLTSYLLEKVSTRNRKLVTR